MSMYRNMHVLLIQIWRTDFVKLCWIPILLNVVWGLVWVFGLLVGCHRFFSWLVCGLVWVAGVWIVGGCSHCCVGFRLGMWLFCCVPAVLLVVGWGLAGYFVFCIDCGSSQCCLGVLFDIRFSCGVPAVFLVVGWVSPRGLEFLILRVQHAQKKS